MRKKSSEKKANTATGPGIYQKFGKTFHLLLREQLFVLADHSGGLAPALVSGPISLSEIKRKTKKRQSKLKFPFSHGDARHCWKRQMDLILNFCGRNICYYKYNKMVKSMEVPYCHRV